MPHPVASGSLITEHNQEYQTNIRITILEKWIPPDIVKTQIRLYLVNILNIIDNYQLCFVILVIMFGENIEYNKQLSIIFTFINRQIIFTCVIHGDYVWCK